MCPPAFSSPAGQRLPCAKGAVAAMPRLRDCPRLLDTSGMLSAACPTHPLRPLAQMLRPAPLARAVDGASLSSRRGRCPHRPVAWHPGRTVGAGLCPRPLLPGLMGPPVKPWGPTHVSARTHFLSGPVHGRTHRSAPTRLPEAFRNQWESMQKTAPASAERREKRRLCRGPPVFAHLRVENHRFSALQSKGSEKGKTVIALMQESCILGR